MQLFITSLLFLSISACECLPAQKNNNTKTSTPLTQPSYLKVGDTVAIVAPSGILKNRNAEINKAVSLLESWGLHVVLGKHLLSKSFHFAGTDTERSNDMQEALDNPSITAIWCARGGYGAVRILDVLDYSRFKKKPKWIVGYSDITALHNQIHNLGFQSIHAMMCTSLTEDLDLSSETVLSLKGALFGTPKPYVLKGSKFNYTGEATGPLVGGNLTLLHSMLGSDTSIDTRDKILFIEEIGEYKYHIDRMLQSLKRAGYFEHCKGVIVGDFTRLKPNTTKWGSSIEQLIRDALSIYNFPIAFNMPAGHEKDNRALILGKIITLNVSKEKSTIEFQ